MSVKEIDAGLLAVENANMRTDLATAGKRICELTGRVAELERGALRLLDRQDFWRSCHTLPGEYDNLCDLIGYKP